MRTGRFGGERLVGDGGVITSVTPVPTPRGLFALSACRASIGSGIPGIGCTDRGDPPVIVGYGSTLSAPDEARLVAIAEAAERYSSGDFLGETRIWARGADLGSAALNLSTLPRCSDREYARPECPFRPADENARMRWVRGFDIATAQEIWVPAIMACFRLAHVRPEERFWYPISTGYAIHTDPAEAVVRGICEVIERDAIALVWLQMLSLPELKIGSPGPADGTGQELELLLDWGDRHFVRTHLLDATTDLGVPTVYCLQVAEHDDAVHQIVGCATSRDLVTAARKTMLETIMVRRSLEAAGPPLASVRDFSKLHDGGHYMAAGERAHAFDFLLERPGPRSGDDAGSLAVSLPEDSQAALAHLTSVLTARGMQAIAVDRTTAELAAAGLTAVSVLIPGLQPTSMLPFGQFLGHDRLRRGPAAMGQRHLPEEKMNPWPQPFV